MAIPGDPGKAIDFTARTVSHSILVRPVRPVVLQSDVVDDFARVCAELDGSIQSGLIWGDSSPVLRRRAVATP